MEERYLFRTQDVNAYSVEFSPFQDGLVAVACSQYFGIVGNGRQFILSTMPGGTMRIVRTFDTNDGLFDCTWNEHNGNQIACASGDGSVKIFDIMSRDNFPIRNFHEHTQECSSVDWNLVSKQSFVTASWDTTVKLWDPNLPKSIRTFAEHQASVYNAQWSPRHPNQFATCSGDGTVKVFDTNKPQSAVTIRAHDGEVLAIDWNKYNEFCFATGSTDRSVRLFDIRQPMRPVLMFHGHQYAIRRLKCSPHQQNIIATCSYDMSVCVWDTQRDDALFMRSEHHSEFVMGVDFNIFRPGQIASCSWDEHVCIYNINMGPPPKIPRIPKRGGGPPPPSQIR